MPGLEDLYKEIILDHYRNPRGRGSLEVPPAVVTEGFNPLCGDEVSVNLDVHDGQVAEVRVGGQGCSISLSSASMMAEAVQGRSVTEVRDLIRTFHTLMSVHEASLDDGDALGAGGLDADGVAPDAGSAELVDDESLGDLVALRGVLKFPQRIKCATLSWNTLLEGLDQL
jgi:nitrogen fixation NifU-like protein